MSKPAETANRGLTHDEVVRLVGELDEGTIASIIATGATYADIEQALSLLGADGGVEAKQRLTPPAEAVHDILAQDPAFVAPDDRNA